MLGLPPLPRQIIFSCYLMCQMIFVCEHELLQSVSYLPCAVILYMWKLSNNCNDFTKCMIPSQLLQNITFSIANIKFIFCSNLIYSQYLPTHKAWFNITIHMGHVQKLPNLCNFRSTGFGSRESSLISAILNVLPQRWWSVIGRSLRLEEERTDATIWSSIYPPPHSNSMWHKASLM